MKTKNKILCCLITFGMLLPLVSCSETADHETDATTPAETEKTTETAETEETAEEKKKPSFLPDGLTYNGMEYSILHGQTITGPGENEITYKLEDITPGDIIPEAVYERTRYAEETLDIRIVSEQIDWSELSGRLSASVTAGDSDFEAVCGRLSVLSQSAPNGYLIDLQKVNTLDLKNDWWDQQVNTSMTVGGKQHIASGALNYYDDYSINCMVFNKDLFRDHNITAPYDLVREGKWTFDAFFGIINDTAADVNNDGRYDENDFYGYVCNTGMLPSMMISFDEALSIVNDNDIHILNQSESLLDKATVFAEKMLNNTSVLVEERELGYEKGDLIFPNGQALMSQSLVGGIVGYRDSMESDFGILPFPKYNEEQNDYHHIISQHWASAVSIPVTCKDTVQVGYVLDTLGFFSPDLITKTVIERNAMTKTVRDADSAEMLELIFATKEFDTSIVFDWGIYNIWTTMTADTDPAITSTLKRNEKIINKTIERFIQKMQEIGSDSVS